MSQDGDKWVSFSPLEVVQAKLPHRVRKMFGSILRILSGQEAPSHTTCRRPQSFGNYRAIGRSHWLSRVRRSSSEHGDKRLPGSTRAALRGERVLREHRPPPRQLRQRWGLESGVVGSEQVSPKEEAWRVVRI